MTRTTTLLLLTSFCVPGESLAGQSLDPALLTKPATDSWPTYAGDYSQRRYSTLTQIDTTNVRHLSLAWVSRLTAGAGGGEGGFFGPPATAPMTGGVAENPVNIPGSTSGSPRLSGSILQVNGILYISSADNAWAMDALDGHVQGDPGLETWASLDAARHGGAQVWMPGSFDPETHLYIIGTGNPTPAYTALLRGPRDVHTNLYTCSVVAVNVETGKMAWYFQTSPNDTHDWDSTQPSVLVDGMFGGKPRKMAMQTSPNGYFYVLDRTSGGHLLTMKYSDA